MQCLKSKKAFLSSGFWGLRPQTPAQIEEAAFTIVYDYEGRFKLGNSFKKFIVLVLKLTFLLPKSVVQRQNCLIKALASGGCAPRPLHRYKGPYSGTLIVENYEILVPKSLFPSLNCLLTALASGGCAPRPLNRCSRHKLTCHVSRDLEKIYPKIAYPHF